MAALRAAKKEMRTVIRQRLSQLSVASIIKQSSIITENLLSLPEYRSAKRIGIYLSMPKGEASTKEIVHDAFKQGKRVFVPYIYKPYSQDFCGLADTISVMDMVALNSVDEYENLKPDAWGIPSVLRQSVNRRDWVLAEKMGTVAAEQGLGSKNSHELQATGNAKLDMIVMPGVAFDRGLRRLGHGKGFYDYFLERYRDSGGGPVPFLAGLSLDVQLLPEDQDIPANSSDYQLDALVVGNGTVVHR